MSTASVQTSSSGYLSIGSSLESVLSSVPTVDTGVFLMRSRRGQASPESRPKIFFCPYHQELSIPHGGFTKKGDCKDHLKEFHALDSEWACPQCHAIFDREYDFTSHYRQVHPRLPLPYLRDIEKELLPKELSACGFQGCENLFTDWNKWFDHITDHMRNGKTQGDWSYNVVLTNLLRQDDLRNHWEHLLICTPIGTPWLDWQPSSTRQLRQKLERRDFRPGIQFLVQAALHLGQSEQPLELATPSRDIIRQHPNLNAALMRPAPINSDPPPPYYAQSSDRRRAPAHPFDPPGEGSMQGPSGLGQLHLQPHQTFFQDYEVSGMERFPDLPSTAFDEALLQSSERSDFPPSYEYQAVHGDPHSNGVQDIHPLQQLNYYDFENFARETHPRDNTPRPRGSGGLLRRVRSSVSLSSRRSQSSLEFDGERPVPPVPPVPNSNITPPGRPRSSSQRSKLSRRGDPPPNIAP